MTGFSETRVPYSAGDVSVPIRRPIDIGQRGKIGGLGQGYDVVGIIDDVFALIHTHRTDDRLAYRIDDIALDAEPTESMARFEPLIGQHRSIGPDGPTYLILKMLDREHALICILESEREVRYPIEEILLDPGPDAAWKNR